MNVERRALNAEYRASPDQPRQFEAVVMHYGPVDDYGTIWEPGVFAESLTTKLPKIVWSHDWSDVVGRGVDYKDDKQRLVMVGEFDEFDSVPRAKQASAQLSSGSIDEFSVGFVRKKWMSTTEMSGDDFEREMGYEMPMGCTEVMQKADLVEVSLVLVGAVPGTELVGMRSVRMANGQTVPGDFVIDLGRKLDKGEITEGEAQKALELVAGGKVEETDDSAAVLDEADQILEELGL
jgi:HK97 family phage prohead protease